MRRRDVPLVFFTILSQWSIGFILCLTALTLMGDGAGPGLQTGLNATNPVLLALLLIVVATTFSFMHLGNPVNALKSIRNLATSWLSREILAIGLYSFTLLLLLLDAWIFVKPDFSGILLLAASLAGLLLLWTMTGVYLIPTVPPWNNPYTAIAFSLATLSLGLAACLALDMGGLLELGRAVSTGLASLLVLILVLEVVFSHLNQRRLVRLDTGFNGPAPDRGGLLGLYRLRVGLLLLAILVNVMAVTALIDPGWLVIGLFLAVMQEIATRVLFYASYFRSGM